MNRADLGNVLVTGGGGFIGGALVQALRDRGLTVRSISRGYYPALEKIGADQIQGDIGDPAVVDRAVEGCQTIFHTAAKAGPWGTDQEFERTNVEGTRNIVASSLRHGVKRIVFTSSPSVVFTGDHMTNADETLPYSTHFEAAYPRTKTESEQLILAANSDDLAIVSLRPHLVWGPGDNNLLPRIISRAKAGRLIKIGLGERLIDPVYIENAIDAHLEAAFRLDPGSPIAGKSYFITQGETIPIWTMINHMLAAAHLPPVKRAVPRPVAVAVSGVIEGYYHLTRRKDEPPMTRFMARQLSTTHWFNIAAARRDLGYEPRVSFAEGLRRLEAWLSAEGSKMGGPV